MRDLQKLVGWSTRVVGLALVALYASGTVQALGTWNPLALVPATGSGVEGMSVASVGNSIYAAYGFDNGVGDTAILRRYDISTDTWTIVGAAPAPARSEGAGIAVGGFFYSIGGRGAGALADIDRFDPLTGTWTSLTNMPTARVGIAVASRGDLIFVIGGRTGPGGPCSGGEMSTVEVYNTLTDTWSSAASLPSARSDASAVTMGGKIYVFGGCTTSAGIAFLADVDVYDPNTDTWSTAPTDLPTARAGLYAVGSKGNKVYVFGGWAGAGPLSVNEEYTVPSDSWATDTPMTVGKAEFGTASHGGRIYAVGGALPAFGASTNDNAVFIP